MGSWWESGSLELEGRDDVRMLPVLVTVPNEVEEEEVTDTALEGGVRNRDHLLQEHGVARSRCACSERRKGLTTVDHMLDVCYRHTQG